MSTFVCVCVSLALALSPSLSRSLQLRLVPTEDGSPAEAEAMVQLEVEGSRGVAIPDAGSISHIVGESEHCGAEHIDDFDEREDGCVQLRRCALRHRRSAATRG